MWYPYLALAAELVPLLLMGIGYMLMGKRDAGESPPGDQRSRL